MAVRNTYFTHNNQNSDGSLTNEQKMIQNLVIESIQIAGFNGYYLPRVLDNVDSILEEAQKESFEKAYELEMYFDAPEDALADSVDYISYFGFEVRDSCDFVFSVKRFQDLKIPDPNRDDARELETPLEGDLIYLPFTNSIFEIKFVEDWSPFFQLGFNYTYKALCRLFIFDNQTFDDLELYRYNDDSKQSEEVIIDTDLELGSDAFNNLTEIAQKQTVALQQIEQVDEDNSVSMFNQAGAFQDPVDEEGNTVVDTEGNPVRDLIDDTWNSENPFGEF